MKTSIAHYYRRQGRDFVSGSTRSNIGLWVSTYWRAVGDPPDIGAEIVAALDAGEAAPPPDLQSRDMTMPWTDPMVNLAGVRSNKAWMTGTVAVFIERDDTTYAVERAKNDGKGFEGTGEQKVLVNPSTAELGAAVEAYLDLPSR